MGAGGKKTADWTEEAFDRMIAVNLKGVWLCMKSQLRQMLKQEGGGTICNVADAGGLVAGVEPASQWERVTGWTLWPSDSASRMALR